MIKQRFRGILIIMLIFSLLTLSGCQEDILLSPSDTDVTDTDTETDTVTETDTETEPEIPTDIEKPVIYLYPEAPTECSVKVTLDGTLTCTYPDHGENGWQNFVAHPDGTLTFPDGKEYYCLYWEGIQNADWNFSQGFCVKGADTAAFLEWALAVQGLTPREANEFIIYWLPLMEANPYNVIAFQTEVYTNTAILEISPAPDSLLRIMMAYYPSDEEVDIRPQTLEGFERDGFTVVEWGGSRVDKP